MTPKFKLNDLVRVKPEVFGNDEYRKSKSVLKGRINKIHNTLVDVRYINQPHYEVLDNKGRATYKEDDLELDN